VWKCHWSCHIFNIVCIYFSDKKHFSSFEWIKCESVIMVPHKYSWIIDGKRLKWFSVIFSATGCLNIILMCIRRAQYSFRNVVERLLYEGSVLIIRVPWVQVNRTEQHSWRCLGPAENVLLFYFKMLSVSRVRNLEW
jgi:hypothetical protein